MQHISENKIMDWGFGRVVARQSDAYKVDKSKCDINNLFGIILKFVCNLRYEK